MAQPGNVEVPEGLGRSVQRDQLITEAAMLEAVVQVEFAGDGLVYVQPSEKLTVGGDV